MCQSGMGSSGFNLRPGPGARVLAGEPQYGAFSAYGYHDVAYFLYRMHGTNDQENALWILLIEAMKSYMQTFTS